MSREYPESPVIGVGAVIVKDGKVLIVKRAHEPRKGEWSLPGGRVELGETLVEATRREIKEETGLDVEVGALVELFDRVHRDAERVRYHFVIADYLCTCSGGTLCAGDDAEDAVWVAPEELEAYAVNAHAAAVIRKGLAMSEAQL
jgi:mutator protein MutT